MGERPKTRSATPAGWDQLKQIMPRSAAFYHNQALPMDYNTERKREKVTRARVTGSGIMRERERRGWLNRRTLVVHPRRNGYKHHQERFGVNAAGNCGCEIPSQQKPEERSSQQTKKGKRKNKNKKTHPPPKAKMILIISMNPFLGQSFSSDPIHQSWPCSFSSSSVGIYISISPPPLYREKKRKAQKKIFPITTANQPHPMLADMISDKKKWGEGANNYIKSIGSDRHIQQSENWTTQHLQEQQKSKTVCYEHTYDSQTKPNKIMPKNSRIPTRKKKK